MSTKLGKDREADHSQLQGLGFNNEHEIESTLGVVVGCLYIR